MRRAFHLSPLSIRQRRPHLGQPTRPWPPTDLQVPEAPADGRSLPDRHRRARPQGRSICRGAWPFPPGVGGFDRAPLGTRSGKPRYPTMTSSDYRGASRGSCAALRSGLYDRANLSRSYEGSTAWVAKLSNSRRAPSTVSARITERSRGRQGGQLLLQAQQIRGSFDRAGERDARSVSRGATQRGSRQGEGRPRGSGISRVSLEWGSNPLGRQTRHICGGGCPAELHHRGGLRARRREVLEDLACRCPSDRKDIPVVPLRYLAGDADGARSCRCRAPFSPTGSCRSAARR